jgi:FdhE protein
MRCAVCAYQWRFIRTECPACENEKADDIEVIFFEQSPYERAELCRSCRKYLIAFDLRKYPQTIVFDVERLGALYLDIIAQERGYFPIAGKAWNVLE